MIFVTTNLPSRVRGKWHCDLPKHAFDRERSFLSERGTQATLSGRYGKQPSISDERPSWALSEKP